MSFALEDIGCFIAFDAEGASFSKDCDIDSLVERD